MELESDMSTAVTRIVIEMKVGLPFWTQMSCWRSCCTQLRRIQLLLGMSSIEVQESLARGLLPRWKQMIVLKVNMSGSTKDKTGRDENEYSNLNKWQKQARNTSKMAKTNDA